MKFTLKWVEAALIRAIRTAAQTALSMFTIGKAIHEVSWMNILSVAAVAAIYSILTSIVTGLPEADDTPITPDGSFVIDGSDPDAYGISVNLGNRSIEEVSAKDHIVLEVKNESVKDQ